MERTNNKSRLPNFLKVGKDVFVWPFAQIINPEVISIGDSVIINDFAFISGGEKTEIGSFVHIAPFSSISGGGTLIIEDFCGLSGGTRVYTGNDDYLGGCLTGPTVPHPYRVPIRSFVNIKKHAIIGANAVILPGVTIGEGAIVGALSFITKDCEPWTIYAGSPGKPIKQRPKDIIIALERQLRDKLYDKDGKYIPSKKRKA